ncbi:MAG TPA: phytanoyl-CoA dioxygenase family protein [Acidimicrobiales bacterium]|nr:phytanoyl-CoA dioxygenase family protein [Acidimicrobiales bacterium]
MGTPAAVTVTDAEVDAFRVDGVVVLRAAVDPAALAREVDGALARGFARPGAVNESDEAAISFRYLPMMSELTPRSVELFRRLAPVAERVLGTPVLPVRAKAVEYHGGSRWHRDSELALPSVGLACYLEPLTAGTGALQVRPGSHLAGGRDADAAAGGPLALDTEPGDVIVLDEHLLHASEGGRVRRQWRCDFVARPAGAGDEAVVRAYYAAMFSPEWDGGYDVDAFPTYGEHWRRVCPPGHDALLERVGAYAAATEEEAASRRRRQE